MGKKSKRRGGGTSNGRSSGRIKTMSLVEAAATFGDANANTLALVSADANNGAAATRKASRSEIKGAGNSGERPTPGYSRGSSTRTMIPASAPGAAVRFCR